MLLFSAAPATQIVGGPEPPDVDWHQNLGAELDTSVALLNASGDRVRLQDLLSERPAILALVYYECPMLCNLVLDGLVRTLRAVPFDAGTEFDVIVLSIDPKETVALAAERKAGYVERYGREGAASGWHFLIGDDSTVAKIAETVGFEYTYLPASDEYAHAAGITLLTPEGQVSRYFYGHEFSPRDVRFGLVEASEGRIGSAVDKVLLRCFRYDPARGKYGFAILSTIRVAGTGTAIFLIAYILRQRRREKREWNAGWKGATSA